jgi:HNH endonuclease
VTGGRVTTEEHVHHVNRDRSDNRPENLRPLSAAEHHAVHGGCPWAEQAAQMYLRGSSTYEIGREVGRNPATVYRRLVQMGVPMRKDARVAVPRREVVSG